jgi:hypothetical protein
MSPQAGWILTEEIVPRLKNTVPRTVKGIGTEDAAELIQDATAIAAQMLHSVELTKLLAMLTPRNLSSRKIAGNLSAFIFLI